MNKAEKRVLVGMSGGIDSTATCLMLQEQGYEVIGLTICFFFPGIFPCISRYSNTITSAWFSSAYLTIAHAIFLPSSVFRRFVYAHLPCVCAEPYSLWDLRIRPSVRYIRSFSLG